MEFKIPANLFGVDGKKALERILAEKDEEASYEVNEKYLKLAEDNLKFLGIKNAKIKETYDLIKKGTYGQAMDILRQDYAAGRIPNHPTYQMHTGTKVVRALTMKETALARMNNYETLKDANGSTRSDEERLALFMTQSFTSTGIAYQKKRLIRTAKFKIIPISEHLVTIAENYNQETIPINYSNISRAEINTTTGKYNQDLTLKEVLENAGWIESFEQDQKTLSDYTHLTFKLLNNPEQAMKFRTIQKPNKNHLRAFVLGGLFGDSYADGNFNLNYLAFFVRVTP